MEKSIDLAAFSHQNRAAAIDQLDKIEEVIVDCDSAINLNNKYVKALDRKAKTLRKQAKKAHVDKLKQCLEDITSVCILEGFQKQEHLMMVDAMLSSINWVKLKLNWPLSQENPSSPHLTLSPSISPHSAKIPS